MTSHIMKWASWCFIVMTLAVMSGCGGKSGKTETYTTLSQLNSKVFAVPTGTAADKLVLSKFPQAKFQYFNNTLDAALAVKIGKVDAVAYDEPVLRNIIAKNDGLVLLSERITVDKYAIAVTKDNPALKATIDTVLADMEKNGTYQNMMKRWFPEKGNPAPMPEMPASPTQGVLKLGTAAVTEPFSFVDASHNVVGFDIEIAHRIAQKLGKKLEIVNMEFGSMIPALMSGKVDMIASCITVTDERAKKVLFSEPYYTGGISVLVKKPAGN